MNAVFPYLADATGAHVEALCVQEGLFPFRQDYSFAVGFCESGLKLLVVYDFFQDSRITFRVIGGDLFQTLVQKRELLSEYGRLVLVNRTGHERAELFLFGFEMCELGVYFAESIFLITQVRGQSAERIVGRRA